jgi:hypothetical protein|nr:MAG TPA: adenine-specific methyltransferase [Caudoviricetes sp.]
MQLLFLCDTSMKMDVVAGSKNDEFYTPDYAIEPLLKYVKQSSVVWCPFDTDKSRFVSLLKKHGCKVINTHIENGDDFFDTLGPKCDIIISNPPYSLKTEVLERLFSLEKPFAMLVGVVGLFESKRRFEMFRDNEFEIMYFDKRISYYQSYFDHKPTANPPFSSVYVCHGVLPKKIVFEELAKK